MTLLRFIFISVLLFTSTLLLGQQLTFDDEPLTQVLQSIDEKSQLSFNYDAKLLEEYTYSGKINLLAVKDELENILHNTPFTYEIIQDNILIIIPDKRNYQVCGWVKDKSYNTELLSATISANGMETGTLTDESGYFELELQAYKDQKLTISYIGYVTKEVMLGDLVNDECLDLYLENDLDLFGSEIVITDYIHTGITEGASFNSTSIDLQKTMKATGHDEHDVLKTVQILPGVSSLDDSAGNLSIRGSTPDQNMLVWERATLYNSGHLFGMISTANPFVLDEVNVFKGIFDPSYDNRIGGLVEMSLPDNMPEKISLGVGSTLSEMHAYLSTPINLPYFKDKLGFIFSTRLSANNFISSPTINRYMEKVFQLTEFGTDLTQTEANHRNNDESINFADTNIKIFFTPFKRLKFNLSLLGSSDNFESYSLVDSKESLDFIQESTLASSFDISFQWHKRFNSTAFLVVSSYDFRYFTQIIGASGQAEIPPFDQFFSLVEVQNNISDLTLGLSNKYSFNARSHLKLDADINAKGLGYYYLDQSEFSEPLIDSGFNQGTFASLSVALDHNTDKLNLMMGTKLSYYNEKSDKAYFSPRLSLRYLIDQDLKIKASAGKLYQFVSQVTLNDDNDLGSLRNFWVVADEFSDEVMNSNKFTVGTVWNKDGWLIDTEVYYNKSFGLSSVSANLNAGVDIIENGESSSIGLETLIQKRWDAYSVWASYTLSQNKYFFPTTNIAPFPANNDHRHNLSLVNTYNIKDLTFTINYNLRSGLPYSSPTRINTTTIDGKNNYTFQFDNLNDKRLKGYHRFDASISYRNSIFKDRLKIEANLSLVNVFDSRNVYTRNSFLDFDEDDPNKPPVIETFDKNLLRRTPKLLVRFYW